MNVIAWIFTGLAAGLLVSHRGSSLWCSRPR